MRKLLQGAAIALVCLAAALPTYAAGPNCTNTTITAFNSSPFSGTATAGSAVAMSWSSGSPTATIYTGGNSQVAAVTWEITGTFTGTLYFQASQDEQNGAWSGINVNAAAGSQTPSGASTVLPGNFYSGITGYTGARVTAIATGALPTWSGTANVYMCVYQSAPSGSNSGTAQQMQGTPFGFPLGSNLLQWGGQNALVGPGPSFMPGIGAAGRVALSRDANPRIIIDDTLPTYRCSASFTPQATAAVTLVSLKGSATSTVRVRKILMSGTATALGISVFALQRTTALGAGGTTVSPTIATLDTNFASAGATALCSHYTATLKAAGSATGGPLSTWVQFYDTVTTPTVTTRSPDIVFPEGGVPGQSIVLRGTGDFLEIQNVSPTNLGSGAVLDYTIEWVEEQPTAGGPAL